MMKHYLDEPVGGEAKRLDLGIGVADLHKGVISLNVLFSMLMISASADATYCFTEPELHPGALVHLIPWASQ